MNLALNVRNQGIIQENNWGGGEGGAVSYPSGGVWGWSPIMNFFWLSKAYRLVYNLSKFGGFLLPFFLLFFLDSSRPSYKLQSNANMK